VDAAGNPGTNPLSTGTTLDQTKVTDGVHRAPAFWNSADDAARRIGIDANKPIGFR